MMNNIVKCQKILLSWLASKNEVSYESIKKFCEYLNVQYLLNEEHSAWTLFYPLFLTGNVDYIGNGFFEVTEPLVVQRDGLYVYTNIFDNSTNEEELFPYIYRSQLRPEYENIVDSCFNAISSLKHYPSVGEIVKGFSMSLIDRFSLKFENAKKKYGVAEKIDCTPKQYCFVYPNSTYVMEVPYWRVNPDAINLAYCYSRSIDGSGNGMYNPANKELRIVSFRCPIMLYRVLFLESILGGYIPIKENGVYVFPGISNRIVKQVNRILNNSIQYG